MAGAAAQVQGPPSPFQGVQQRLDEQVGRVREPREHIVRLGVDAEHPEQLPIRRPAGAGKQSSEGVQPRAVQAEQRVQRVVTSPRFQRVHGVPRGVVGDQDRNPRDNREGAALATEDAGPDARGAALERRVVDDGQTGAAERAAQQAECFDQHVGMVQAPTADGPPGWPRGPSRYSGRVPRSSRNVRPEAPAAARR